jgi:putative lipoic acid-binding regulatory protein
MSEDDRSAPGDGGDEETLVEFPCAFPIKVMGRADQGLEEIVRDLVHETLSADRLNDMRVADSSAGRFVSVTVTVQVEEKSELDSVYAALTAHAKVMMVL